MSGELLTPVWPSDPADQLRLQLHSLADPMRPANPALQHELFTCQRWQGDWLALLIAPEVVRWLLLPGGGELWGDIPLGQRRYLTLAGHDWAFHAAEHPVIGGYQYCDLLPSTMALHSMADARLLALDALTTLGLPLAPSPPPEAPRTVSRRGFLRALGGRR